MVQLPRMLTRKLKFSIPAWTDGLLFRSCNCNRDKTNAAAILTHIRLESDYVTREERIRNQMKYKPYTWEERNQFFYPKIEDREQQVSEILHRDSIVGRKKPERYAEFHFARPNIPYSPRKMWYVCQFVRNKWIDDALAHLSSVPTKGARIMEETLQHAKQVAVEEHNVEFEWNLHVAFCSAQRTKIDKGIIWHMRFPENPNNLFGHSKRRYSNIQLMLREGPPPPPEKEFDGHDREKYFLDKLRKRQILNSW